MSTSAIAVVAVLSAAYLLRIERLRWAPLPAASLAALDRCPDNLYNRYDEGGYLIWFAPARRVFIDGRQDPYPPSFVLDHIRVERSGDYPSTFDRHHIRCAYLPVTSPVASRLQSAGWAALYRDSDWTVLARP
jgi:hypothetical protein